MGRCNRDSRRSYENPGRPGWHRVGATQVAIKAVQEARRGLEGCNRDSRRSYENPGRPGWHRVGATQVAIKAVQEARRGL